MVKNFDLGIVHLSNSESINIDGKTPVQISTDFFLVLKYPNHSHPVHSLEDLIIDTIPGGTSAERMIEKLIRTLHTPK